MPESLPEIIDIYHKDWTKKLLSELYEDEMFDGYPRCDGLRRLFEKYIGRIYAVRMNVNQAPVTSNLNRATVTCSIQYLPHDLNQIFEIEDVADCDENNTKVPYVYYPSATAATMAEGRVLRKGLRLKTISAEEAQRETDISTVITDAIKEQTKMSDTQKTTIINLSKIQGIDSDKLIKLEFKDKNINDLSYHEACKILQRLNAYQRGPDNKKSGGLSVPTEILMDK